MVDRRPRAIVRCTSVADVVAEAVHYGREHELEIGGARRRPQRAGQRVPDGGVMIDLSLMRASTWTRQRRRARAHGGVLSARLDASRRSTWADDVGGQRVATRAWAGYTLGGGHGLARAPSRAAVRQRGVVRVVWPTGVGCDVDEAGNPELFWALRGGGGNFGVVTEFEFRLHPVSSRAHVVDLFFGVEDAAAAMRGWRDLSEIAPRAATFTAWVGESQSPILPLAWHDRPVASLGCVWAGSPEMDLDLLATLRALGRPIAERVVELSYLALQTIDDTLGATRGAATGRAITCGRCRTRRSRAPVSRTDDGSGAGLPNVRLQAFGGAIADVPDADSAFSHRHAKFEFVTSAAGPTRPRTRCASPPPGAIPGVARAIRQRRVRQRRHRRGRQGVRRAYPPAKLARLAPSRPATTPTTSFTSTTTSSPPRGSLKNGRCA